MALPVRQPIERVIDMSKQATLGQFRCSCNKFLFDVKRVHGTTVIATTCPRCKTPYTVTLKG